MSNIVDLNPPHGDPDYFKPAYSGTWGISSSKEWYTLNFIADNTGLKLEFFGFGAGSTEYIHGSAKQNGSLPGGADLHILKTNIHVEVTGQLKLQSLKYVRNKGLWFRPDKFDTAIEHPEWESWFCHCVKVRSETGIQYFWLRFVLIDEELIYNYKHHKFKLIITDTEYMNHEKFIEIPANYHKIISQWEFLNKINEKVA